MFRTLYVLLIGLALVAFPYRCIAKEPEPEVPDKKLHTHSLYPTVLLRSEDNSSFGSGVVVRSFKIEDGKYINYFLSSNHVVSADETFYAEVFKYEDWSTIVGTSAYKCYHYANKEENDLYVGYFITSKELLTSTIDFSTKFYIGTPLFGIGCGLKDDPRLEYGKVSAPIMRSGGFIIKNTVRASIHTVPGDSGGGVFNKNYQLVGITKAIKRYKGQLVFNVRYFVPLVNLKSWGDAEKKNFKFLWTNDTPPVLDYYRNLFTKDMTIIK